jgi:hypothetical protein
MGVLLFPGSTLEGIVLPTKLLGEGARNPQPMNPLRHECGGGERRTLTSSTGEGGGEGETNADLPLKLALP